MCLINIIIYRLSSQNNFYDRVSAIAARALVNFFLAICSLVFAASTALIKSEQAVEGSGLSDNEQTCSNKIQSDTMISPKQRYYLGENPYGSSLFGKENKYNADSVRQRNFYNIHKDQEIPRQSPVELHNKR